MKPYITFNEHLLKVLKDPEEAAAYLNVVMEDGDQRMFLVALRNVAEAQGGMSKLSRKTKLNRANLYRIFSKKGNPEITTLTHILDAYGLSLAVVTKNKAPLKKAA